MKHAKWILWILILPMPLLLVGSLCWTCWTISQNQPFGETSSFVAEELVIRNCESTSDDSVTFTILNVGRDSSTIVFAYINGETATLEPNVSRDGYNACTIHKDTSANFTVTLQDQTHFNSSETYEFKLITGKGTTISNIATYNLVTLQTDRMQYWSYPILTVLPEFPYPEPSPEEPTPTPYNPDVKITKLSWDTSRPKTLIIQVQSFLLRSYNITRVQFWHEGTTKTTHRGTWEDTIVNITPTLLSPFKTQTVIVNLEGVLQPGEYKVCILVGPAKFGYSGFLEV